MTYEGQYLVDEWNNFKNNKSLFWDLANIQQDYHWTYKFWWSPKSWSKHGTTLHQSLNFLKGSNNWHRYCIEWECKSDTNLYLVVQVSKVVIFLHNLISLFFIKIKRTKLAYGSHSWKIFIWENSVKYR